jgi:hypothetical protein
MKNTIKNKTLGKWKTRKTAGDAKETRMHRELPKKKEAETVDSAVQGK